MTDLHALADWFADDAWPDIRCPVCRKGDLAKVDATVVESAESSRLHSHEAWEPEWIRGHFTAHLRCQRSACEETVVALGQMKVDYGDSWDESWESQYATYLQVLQILPAPPIADIVASCPQAVLERLDGAARVIWSDPSAAANRLRYAVERVLDDQGVVRMSPKGGTLSTHARISEFRKKNQPVADALEAVKWIGNQGSHEDSLTRADVIEGGQILAHALELLYDDRRDKMRRRVEGIIADKGVRRALADDGSA